jgi:hypothetical protein
MASIPQLGTPSLVIQPADGHVAAGGESAAPVEQNVVPACCTDVRRTQPFGANTPAVGSEGPVVR